jgi:hypothetical protein
VSLEQTDEGADIALAIESADGVMALIRFRSRLLRKGSIYSLLISEEVK